MSKKKATRNQQPDYLKELMETGTAILVAKSPEELADMVNDIPAECHYGAGAIGRNPETGAFSLRIDLVNT